MDNQITKLELFGKRLAEYRRNRNYTQDELANRLGVTPQALSKWEKGISSPDVLMISAICEILEINADYLLGAKADKITENGDEIIQSKIWNNLRNGLEPLELLVGESLVPLFLDGEYVDKILECRINLSKEGMLMPIVHVRDELRLGQKEFMILAYQNVLYSEEVNEVNETTLEHIMQKLEKVVHSRYTEIINVDMLRSMVDNLRIKYPTLVDEAIPSRMSYALLLDVVKGVLARGNSLIYLPKMIEIAERESRENEQISTISLIENICNQIECVDNFYVLMSEK